MPLEELEKQLLSLSPIDRLRLIQSVIQSLIPNSTSEPFQSIEDLNRDLSELPARGRSSALIDRTPNHPLRNLPLTIPPNFDEPMPDLWDALAQ